jgi:hypothetical protein
MRVLLIALLAAISYAQTEVEVAWTAGFGDSNARTMTASVGETLKFKWTGGHNVYVMPDAASLTGACDFSGATELCATRDGDDGSCTTTLTTFPAYFACEVGNHCQNGQHLTVTEESSGSCPTACTNAINGVECPFNAETDLSGLSGCGATDVVACATVASTKATECANASTGDCAQACVDAINAVDCSTWDGTEYPDGCSVTTGCGETLSTKLTQCNARDCPDACANAISAISDDACATQVANLEGCGFGDVAPCAAELAAKTEGCNNTSNCPSSCSSAISAVNCPFTAADIPSTEGCTAMDIMACATEGASKVTECVNGDSSASGLSVVFALFAFAFSQL